MSKSKQACRWSFTLFYDDEAELVNVSEELSKPSVRYAVYGKEICPKTKKPHVQGYVSFQKPKRFSAVKKVLGQQAHVEVSTRSEEENFRYCSKDGDYQEYGRRSNPGKRTDLDLFCDDVKQGNFDLVELRDKHRSVFARHSRFCLDYIQDYLPKAEVETFPLYKWQQDLNEYLKLPPVDREILFYVDESGNSGKSWFCKYYRSLHDHVQIIKPGKFADMAYQLFPILRVLFLDCPRSKQGDFIQYDFLEALKDGLVPSGKYESRMKEYGPVHVVVMMNEYPDQSKLSIDRYNIKII